VISVRALSKSFGRTRVVDDVSFEVQRGELVALLGPSGSGKSTVLRMIAGLEAPDAGEILVEGRDATRTPVQERSVGFVFQHYALFRHMNVRDNVGFGLEVRGTPRKEARRRADELLELVHLSGLGDRHPSQLSGGQRQRVALARALAPAPSMLLLDEPFGALDTKVRADLRAWMRGLQRERGITALIVTHDQDEALELADRVVLLHRGRVEQIGRPTEVYDHPASPFVASFLGSSNVLTGVVREGRLEAGAVALDASGSREGEAQAFVRHHQVEVLGHAQPTSEAGDQLRARIRAEVRLGWRTRLELELSDGRTLVAELPRDRSESLNLSVGDEVFVALRAPAVFVEDYVI
jgi:sulfate transport system ATP-binding protein